MEIVNYLGVDNVVKFGLLLARFGALVAFFPFYGHLKIPMTLKNIIAIVFTFIMLPYAKNATFELSTLNIFLAIISELSLGFAAGLCLYLVFGMLELAGSQMAFVMGFTMANVMDPQTGTSSPLTSQFLTLLGLSIFLAFDGHHLILLLYYKSLQSMPLGGFYPNIGVWEYISKGVLNLFLFGFILSFPIKAMSILADVIFGMLMKTMPSFNLLVVGYPIKITISFAVLIATMSAIFSVFKTQIIETLNNMFFVFFS